MASGKSCKALWIILFCGLAVLCAQIVHARDERAAELFQGIQKRWEQGRKLDACKLAVKMAPYKDGEVYNAARDWLAERGITIATPLESFTLQQIIALENQLESNRGSGLPNAGPRKSHLDAWGSPLRVEQITRQTFLYMIRSAGPDREFLTLDDLAIGVRSYDSKHEELSLDSNSVRKQTAVDAARAAGRASMVKGKGLAEGGSGGGGGNIGLLPGGSVGRSGGGGGGGGGDENARQPLHPEEEVTVDELLSK